MTTTKDRHGDHKCKLDIMCFLCIGNHIMERDMLLAFVRQAATERLCPDDNYIYEYAKTLLQELGYEE